MPEVRPELLRRAVDRAAQFEHIRSRYGARIAAETADAFAVLPWLDKSDLAACASELRTKARRAPSGSYVFASGGTMGAPKLSFIPAGFFLDAIVELWQPLKEGDVFLNLFAPGRLWASHYFYNELAGRLGAMTVAAGSLGPDEHIAWIEFAEDLGVTAIGGTPTALRQFLASCKGARRTLASVESVLWVGEPFRRDLAALVGDVLPNAGLWGLYGSTETWVIGFNAPGCPTDVFHPLPHQFVEVAGDERIAVTTTHEECLNPIVRYVVGDRGSWVDCACGRGQGLRVEGRADSAVKFRGTLVHGGELVELARTLDGIRDAQVAIVGALDGRERMEVRCVADDRSVSEAEVRSYLLGRSLDISNLFDDEPGAFRVTFVEELAVTPRSVKTPPLVREEAET